MPTYLEQSLDKDCNDVTLLCHMFSIKQEMQRTFVPIIEYLYWFDSKNLEEFTSKWYLAAKGFFVYKLHKRHHRRKAMLLFNNIQTVNSNYVNSILKNKFTSVCKYCVKRLAKSSFMFGERPTSADAQLYSYLAIILKPPLPSNEFAVYIRQHCYSLVKFMERLDSKYFPEIVYEEKYLKRKCNSTKFNKMLVVPLICLLATFILIAILLWIF